MAATALSVVDVGHDKRIAIYFQGQQTADLFGRSGAACVGPARATIDIPRLRRVIRPLMSRPMLIIVHANRRCRCITGSWYGRARTFRYFNHWYRNFDADVITLVVNPDWFARKRVRHGPYYIDAARRYRRYPWQQPMDALVYVLAHELAHHVLYTRRHPMRRSERATDLFAMQHLYQVEPRHPIARQVHLTNRELGWMIELLRRTPAVRAVRRHRRHQRRVQVA